MDIYSERISNFTNQPHLEIILKIKFQSKIWPIFERQNESTYNYRADIKLDGERGLVKKS